MVEEEYVAFRQLRKMKKCHFAMKIKDTLWEHDVRRNLRCVRVGLTRAERRHDRMSQPHGITDIAQRQFQLDSRRNGLGTGQRAALATRSETLFVVKHD